MTLKCLGFLASNVAKDEFRRNRLWPVDGTAFTLDRLEDSGVLSLYRKSSKE
jgi:hypothetical protein